MTVPQAIWTLIGLGVLAALLCWVSETWRDVFGGLGIVAVVVAAVYAGVWCVAMGVRAVGTLLVAAGWIG